MTRLFLCDGAFTPRREPRGRREEIEERIRQLRMMKWSDPGDRREIEGMIEAAEAELRSLRDG